MLHIYCCHVNNNIIWYIKVAGWYSSIIIFTFIRLSFHPLSCIFLSIYLYFWYVIFFLQNQLLCLNIIRGWGNGKSKHELWVLSFSDCVSDSSITSIEIDWVGQSVANIKKNYRETRDKTYKYNDQDHLENTFKERSQILVRMILNVGSVGDRKIWVISLGQLYIWQYLSHCRLPCCNNKDTHIEEV